MKTHKALAVFAALGCCSAIVAAVAGPAPAANFSARVESLTRDLAVYAAPVPEWLQVRFDAKTAGLGGLKIGEGGVKEIVLGKDAASLSEDELRPLIAHFLGHAIVSHRLDGLKSTEKEAFEAGAHVYGAEVMARRGMRAEAYVKALKGVAARHKQSLCDLTSGLDSVAKKRDVIDGEPNVLLYARLALGRGDIDAAYRAYKHLAEGLKPFEDPVLLNSLGWLSLMRLAETNPAKVRAETEAVKDGAAARHLFVRSFVVPQKPVKLRSGEQGAVPAEIEEALVYFARAHKLAPHWLAPRINELYALDIAVHLHGGKKGQKETGGRLADALRLTAVSAGPEEKIAAFNAAGIWLANEGDRAGALSAFESARAAVPCEDAKTPNAWITCWNGWLAELQSDAKPGRFSRDSVAAVLAKSAEGHGALSSACAAIGVKHLAKRPDASSRAWALKKGGIPPELRKEIAGFGPVPMETVEKYSQWLEKHEGGGSVFQAADGSILIAKGDSAMTIMVSGGGEDARKALAEVAAKIDSKLCFETAELPGGAKEKEKCCMVPHGGSVTMSCASGDGAGRLVFEIKLDETS